MDGQNRLARFASGVVSDSAGQSRQAAIGQTSDHTRTNTQNGFAEVDGDRIRVLGVEYGNTIQPARGADWRPGKCTFIYPHA